MSLELTRKSRNPAHWISSGWLGLSQDPSGPWLPDVLIHWCQQLDLSLGFVRVCLGGQTAWKSLQSGLLSPHQGLPLTLYFPLFITVSRLLILVSVDCTYPMAGMLWYISGQTWDEAVPHPAFDLKYISHSACMWLTCLSELLAKDTAKIGSICNREQGWSLMYVSQGSNRVDKGIKLWN